MLKLQSPLNGDEKPRQKAGRKPLQPKNSESPPHAASGAAITKPRQGWIEISVTGDANKENHPLHATPRKLMEPLDTSLAEELSATRKKLERLKLDKGRTEKILRERRAVLDRQMQEILQRGDAQKRLEIEVDRLYRLKQLRSYTERISSIRSLREKEDERKISELQSQEMGAEGWDGSDAGIALPSPCPSPASRCGSNSESSQFISAE